MSLRRTCAALSLLLLSLATSPAIAADAKTAPITAERYGTWGFDVEGMDVVRRIRSQRRRRRIRETRGPGTHLVILNVASIRTATREGGRFAVQADSY